MIKSATKLFIKMCVPVCVCACVCVCLHGRTSLWSISLQCRGYLLISSSDSSINTFLLFLLTPARCIISFDSSQLGMVMHVDGGMWVWRAGVRICVCVLAGGCIERRTLLFFSTRVSQLLAQRTAPQVSVLFDCTEQRRKVLLPLTTLVNTGFIPPVP